MEINGSKKVLKLTNPIFITGVAGFIGSNLAKRLLATFSETDIVGLDNMNDYYDVRLKEYRLKELMKYDNFTFIKGNLADKNLINSIFQQYQPQIVVNLGAQAGVRYSITNPDAYIEANLVGFYNILEACRHSYDEGNTPVEHLVYASSSSVYGSNKKVPYSTEDKVDNPVSLYAATKKSNELMAHAYSKLYNIPSTGLRFFTVYGPAGRPDMAYFGFTNKLLHGDTIQIFNYGNCKRDFTYVDDIVEGVVRVMQGAPKRENGEDGLPIPPYAIYNIGNQNPENLLDFVQILQEELIRAGVLPEDYDFEAHKKLVPMQPGDVPVTYADTSALERDYGYKPSTPLRIGLRKFAEWYKQFYMPQQIELFRNKDIVLGDKYMLFNSINFMIFFPIVVLIYFIIPDKVKYIWLLAASYFFYMCWNAKYIILIFASTVITYVSGLLIDKVKDTDYKILTQNGLKKVIVFGSVIINLSILFYFKYINFAVEIITRVLAKTNVSVNIPVFDVILPVGISFYTFQALSYTIDVYRGDIYAEKNFLRYALFVSFFPQLVAGPIERSRNLLKQLAVPKKFSFENVREGLLLMLWGFFLKIVLADRIAIFVDTVYANYTTYSGMYVVVATVLFAVQIYCDFFGYSTIAMGTAKVLGVDLMENFDAPYMAASVAEFWRRWHISLTSWFKDYLYIPLGGSRRGKLRKYVNKMIVFCVSGLWHGASLSFVMWGGMNGAYQVVGEIMQPVRSKLVHLLRLNKESLGHRLLRTISTFILIDFSWIFFRANGFKESLRIIKSIFVKNPWILFDGSLYR